MDGMKCGKQGGLETTSPVRLGSQGLQAWVYATMILPQGFSPSTLHAKGLKPSGRLATGLTTGLKAWAIKPDTRNRVFTPAMMQDRI
jgi:hypothetical protein